MSLKARLKKNRERKQERRLEKAGYYNEANGISFHELTSRAFQIVTSNLILYGNVLSKLQQTALYELAGWLTRLAMGDKQGRFAFPLATGLGKTQSVVAWIAAVYWLEYHHISVAVCASKVEALCDLKRDLMSQGVPEDKIGLLHSYKHDPEKAAQGIPGYASLPATDNNASRPYLLCTHNRVTGKGGIEEFNQYQGQDRDLLIWDESLLKSEGRSISQVVMKSSLGWIEPKRESRKGAKECMDYLHNALALIADEKDRLKEGGTPEAINLPELTVHEVQSFKVILGSSPVVKPLHFLLDISQQPLRVVSTAEGGGFIHYDLVVPAELKNIVILDASYPIRELCRMDKSINSDEEDEGKVEFAEGVVSYENVTIHQLKHNGGRNAIIDVLSRKAEEQDLCKEIVQVVKGIPEDQGVILFNFKARIDDESGKQLDFIKPLKAHMRRAGIDLEAKITVMEKGVLVERDRLVWPTWGNHTSLNEYSYCENVILVGILHRSTIDLYASMIGQREDLLSDVDGKSVVQVRDSEVAHCVYQAISRGRCRTLTNGVANKTNVWIVHKPMRLRESINKVMPGVQWKTWEPVYLESEGKAEKAAKAIVAVLNELPEGTEKVSSSMLKKKAGLKDLPRRTFTRARDIALSGLPEWSYEGRSFVFRCIWGSD